MSLQRNVQQQNAATKIIIKTTAMAFSDRSDSTPWLESLLASNQLLTTNGILVSLAEMMEQEGNLMVGIWLTTRYEFFEFEVMVTRDNQKIIDIELFENITETTTINLHQRGTGQSFGALAIQVLDELMG